MWKEQKEYVKSETLLMQVLYQQRNAEFAAEAEFGLSCTHQDLKAAKSKLNQIDKLELFYYYDYI